MLGQLLQCLSIFLGDSLLDSELEQHLHYVAEGVVLCYFQYCLQRVLQEPELYILIFPLILKFPCNSRKVIPEIPSK